MSDTVESDAVDVVEATPVASSSSTPSERSVTSSPEPFSNVSEEYLCQICNDKYNTPRVLSCLHVFCTPCIEKQIERDDDCTADTDNKEVEQVDGPGSISCPECKQVTRVMTGASDIQEDHIMMNQIDMLAIEDKQIICTSCKAKEKAVARCSDCANFLCPNCVTAHQYMRCFENHKVVCFDDLKDAEGGMSLHKPLFCKQHPSEGLKFYCKSCQTLICNECMIGEHKPPEHSYDRIPESAKDSSYSAYINELIKETKSKHDICQEVTCSLDGSLRDLQMQRDNVRGLIQETFQSYKALLESRQDELLNDLEKIHSAKELGIMEVFHTIEKIIEKTEDGCKFAERVLQHGNCAEILSMKKLISSQLLSLINNTPTPDISVAIEFQTDPVQFEEAVKKYFGHYKIDAMSKDTPAMSPHSSFENEGIALPPGLLSPDASVLAPVQTAEFISSLSSLPPISPGISTSAAASGNSLNSIAASIAGLSQQTIHSIASSLQNLPSVERSCSRNSYSPAMSDSGISVDAASNSSGTTQPTLSYTSLTKLGSVSVNERGQVTLNGQVIQGLSASNVSGLPPSLTGHRAQTPTTPAPDSGLAGLLSSMSMSGSTVHSQTPPPLPVSSSRSQTPQLNELASLLSQTSPTLGSLTAITGSTGVSVSGNSTAGLLAADGKGVVLPSNTPLGIPPPTTPTFGQQQGTPVNFFGQGQSPFPPRSTNKMSAMQIRCKFGQLGPGKSQFNSPHGFCLGMDEDIVVADTNNHRIQVFEKTGEFKYQFGIPGREEGQLWYPRKVAVVRHSGKYVVCDRGNERSRMQIFTKNGHFIKKIAIRYIDIVAGLAVTAQGHIVAVDSVSPTVFVIGETGDLIKWFDCSDFMREPSDIAINGKEYFVCDFKGHCVVVFNEDGQFVRRIGCENITNYPNGIDISDAGDVLVGDSHGNRFHVAVFQRDGSIIGEFECPYVKVSRCCGLKITSEGYVVTLAKNNHHVLVLNTLYIS